MSRLDEIQARLSASESASGTKWETHGPTTFGGYAVHSADPLASVSTDEYLPEESADLFANAPADLAALAETVKATQEIHRPGLVRLETLGFDFDTDEYRTRVVTPCAGCHHEYPCPTAKALDPMCGAS